MDQLEGTVHGSTTILVAGEDSATTGLYYAIPVVMDSSGTTTTSKTNTSTATTTTTNPNTFLSRTATGPQSTSNILTRSNTTNGTSPAHCLVSPTPTSGAPPSLQEVHLGHDDIDDEYAQFTAEHSHMSSENFHAESLGGNKGSIVKAEPLQLFTDPSDPSQSETVEMFTM